MILIYDTRVSAIAERVKLRKLRQDAIGRATRQRDGYGERQTEHRLCNLQTRTD